MRYGKWLDENELPARLEALIRRGDSSIASKLVANICSKESFESFHRLNVPSDCKNFAHQELPEVIQSLCMREVSIPLAYSLLYLSYPPEIIVKSYRVIDALIKRYWITRHLRVKPLGEFLSNLANHISEQQVAPDTLVSLLRERILGFDASRDRLLDDDNFVASLAIQQDIDDTRAKHVLLSLAQYEARQRNQIFDPKTDGTLEHILPQDWPIQTSGWRHFSDETHQSFHKRLGNLMMLTRKENEDADQDAFSAKKMIYETSPWFPSSEIASYDKWDSDNILDRQIAMARKLTKVWSV